MFEVHYQGSPAPGLFLSNMSTLFYHNLVVTCQSLAGSGTALLTIQAYRELEKSIGWGSGSLVNCEYYKHKDLWGGEL